MRKTLLDKLCCPFDKNDLEINIFNEDDQGEVQEGLMFCPECSRYYPVIFGIPIMTPDEYRQKSLEAPIMERWGLEIDANDKDRFRLANPQELIKAGEIGS